MIKNEVGILINIFLKLAMKESKSLSMEMDDKYPKKYLMNRS